MKKKLTRREFIKASTGTALGAAVGSLTLATTGCSLRDRKPIVSVVRIEKDKIGFAVEQAIDLLGGIETVAKRQERIMLKPNLVNDLPEDTTNPEVIRTLAGLMKNAGKEVLIGEGSAAAVGFNVKGDDTYRTTKSEVLDPMQRHVFEKLGYSELATSMKIPLVNLHSGEMRDVRVQSGFVFDTITLSRSLIDVDMLCSVPMMKTHGLATVTLGMKNLLGLYPGTKYYSVRSWVHDYAAKKGSIGVAGEIVDMVRANKLGLVVVDGSVAMEGQGPSVSYGGKLVKMNVIIAGTNPLATDMIASTIMGFDPKEIPTFAWAQRTGMKPASVDEIEVRGEKTDEISRRFARPDIVTWESISHTWGVKEI
jgi:uncharacterized protein (DUF362 family)